MSPNYMVSVANETAPLFMCDPEEWRDIIGYEGVYRVSDWGRVRRIATGRMLKQFLNPQGYSLVHLCLHGRATTRMVSHLVADAFLPAKTPTDTVVRHLNDDPSDNRAVNLARGTVSDNAHDAIRNGKWHPSNGSANGQAKLTEDNAREIRRLCATGKFSQQELALKFGVADSVICRIINRRAWKHVV